MDFRWPLSVPIDAPCLPAYLLSYNFSIAYLRTCYAITRPPMKLQEFSPTGKKFHETEEKGSQPQQPNKTTSERNEYP